MKANVGEFFKTYERSFNSGLAGELDPEQVSSAYAAEFIAVDPRSIKAGKNDAELWDLMKKGYERYRSMGTKEMKLMGVDVHPIDEGHCVARVSWRAFLETEGSKTRSIDFDISYFLEESSGRPKIFGWVGGDERAALRQSGIIS